MQGMVIIAKDFKQINERSATFSIQTIDTLINKENMITSVSVFKIEDGKEINIDVDYTKANVNKSFNLELKGLSIET